MVNPNPERFFLIQGHIENEIDMSLEKSCSRTCEDFKISKSNTCYKDLVSQILRDFSNKGTLINDVMQVGGGGGRRGLVVF